LSGTKGTVWQYTAIDVASAFTWAELHTSERNPRSRHTRALVHRVARELAAAGRNSRRSPPTTDLSFAPANSATRSRTWAPASASSAPDDPTPTAASSAHSSRSSKSAGAPPSPLARSEDDRPGPGPRRVPLRLQLRPRPHRAPHPRTRARRHCLRSTQNQPGTMTSCRTNPGLGRPPHRFRWGVLSEVSAARAGRRGRRRRAGRRAAGRCSPPATHGCPWRRRAGRPGGWRVPA
jgi:hypothetical protein